MKVQFTIATAFLFMLAGAALSAQEITEITVQPKGAYAEIDVASSNDAAQKLIAGNDNERAAAMEAVMKEPNRYNPVVFYALGQTLFELDRRDEAMYWLLIGEIRARIDATICADASARQGVSVLRRSVSLDLMRHMVDHAEELVATLDSALEYIREHNAEYDRRWINLHGMGAMISGMSGDGEQTPEKPLSAPEDTWPQLKTEAMEGYRESYMKMVD